MRKKEKQEIIDRVKAVIMMLRPQFPRDRCANVVLAIIEQAGNDLAEKEFKKDAIQYLSDPFHADWCGVERTWITKTFKKAGLI